MLGQILGAVVTGGLGLLGKKSSDKASKQAADAQVQAARESNALATQFRAENTANFAPNMASGLRANSLLDSFLHPPQAASGAPTPVNDGGMGTAGMPFAGGGGTFTGFDQSAFMPDFSVGQTAMNGRGAANLAQARARASMPGILAQPTVANPPASVMTTAPANALSGYDQFVQSPYYQTPLQEGIRARNMGYAARGQLQSGAALKELDRFGQNYGAGRMDEYLGLAERQANRGVTGASAIAGVGQNALSAMTANNQSAADALANAALLRGQAANSLYGTIAGSLGTLASSFRGFGK